MTTKENLLEIAYKKVIDVGIIGDLPLSIIDDVIDKDLMAFGTTFDEKFFSRSAFKKMIKSQREQSAQLNIKWTFSPLSHRIVNEGNVAIFVDDVSAVITAGNETIDLYLRMTLVFEFIKDKWMLLHIHASKPEKAEIEKDTFGIDEWKQKKEELEKIITERTADLLEKNRELEIEAALEKVRARTMAMTSSEELADASLVLDQQVRVLGIQTRGCAFHIYGETDSTEWFSSEMGTMPVYKTPREKIFLRYHQAGQKGEALHIEEFSGKACAIHYDYLCTLPVMGDALKKMIADGGSFPTRQIDHVTYFKYGYLLFITLNQVPEAHNIFKRFAKIFEQTYTRFLDLQKAEVQTREAKIEAAVERVRAEAMAMHSTSDFEIVVKQLLQQIQQLNLEGFTGAQIILIDEKEFLTVWDCSSPGNIGDPKSETIRYEAQKFPIMGVEILNKWKEGHPYFVLDFDLKKLRAAVKEWKKINVNIADIINDAISGGHLTHQWDACGRLHNGMIAFDMIKPPDDDVRNITIKMTHAFEQAYTRFLDLQKAEAQVREAQIEAALEKVRSTSLAMHKSDELKDVILEVLKKLQDLGIAMENRATAIFTYEKESKDYYQWVASPEYKTIISFLTPYIDHPVQNDIWNARQNGKDFYAKSYTVQEKNSLFKYFFEHTVLKSIMPEEDKKKALGFKHYDVAIAFEKNSAITLVSHSGIPLTEGENAILKRFAKVFEQSYTRFLDLQKAEASAREAQIEAALEKVRSRSMGMQKSEDLKGVIQVVYDEFVQLKINVEHTGFIIDYKTNDDMHIWLADKHKVPAEITIRYFDSPHWNSFVDAKENGKDFFANQLSFEEKNKFYTDLFELIPGLLEEIKEYYLSCEALAISTVLIDNVGLYIENFTGTVYTDEENKILMRFGKVFQQTYTRFLDLQKAEAQTREAQIETALERVRSRSMAMHTTSELQGVIHTVHQELLHLNMAINGGSFIVINKEIDKEIQCWGSGDTANVSEKIIIPRFEKPFYLNLLNGIKTRKEFFTEDFSQEEKKEFFTFLLKHKPWSNLNSKEKKEVLSTSGGYIRSCCVLKHTSIFIVNDFGKKYSDDENEILKRFAKVFDQTYTRFLDLQKAEEQALRAEHDLIEIKNARKKAEDALKDLKSTQSQLIQSEKMASLGELTAGIAHEIQNPLNFVNNFSEVNKELVDELQQELKAGKIDDAIEISNDIKANEEKINHHGKRADAIVKGMLQHSQSSTGKKEPTDINALCDEYLRLSYHGLRAKNKSFNATMKTDFDKSIGNINIVPQDIGRVILNLLTNAFYVVDEKKKSGVEGYEPTVSISTKKVGDKVEIKVADNGNGIPQKVLDKIFQPFFTTKPTGKGTGLGLSLAFDIVTKGHGGELKVDTREARPDDPVGRGEGTTFTIILPA